MKRTDARHHIGNLFQSGNPLTGQRGTRLDHTWLNAVQEELAGVVEAAGMPLDAGDSGQLLKAIQTLSAPSFATLADAGAVNGATLLPANVTKVRVEGHTVEGTGGAHYRRSAGEPIHPGKFQDASGQWWGLHEFVPTVDMFGAMGDGTTDDTAAIQAALSAASARFGTIYIPAGRYIVSAMLTAHGDISIMGEGEDSVIAGSFAGPVLQIGAKDGNNRTTGRAFRGFKIKAGPRCDIGIEWSNLQRCSIDDVRVEGDIDCRAGFAAHRITGAFHTNTLDGLRAERVLTGDRSRGYGLHMGNAKRDFASPYAICNANVFTGLHATGFGHGVVLDGDVSNSVFLGPTTEGGSNEGFVIRGGQTNTVQDLWNENSHPVAIRFSAATIEEYPTGTTRQVGTNNAIIRSTQLGSSFHIDDQVSPIIENFRINRASTIGSGVQFARASVEMNGAGSITDAGTGTWLEKMYVGTSKDIVLNAASNGTGLRITTDSGKSELVNLVNGQTIRFGTFEDGGAINVSSLVPTGDNAVPLGAAAMRWSTLFAGTSAINTSDARDKRGVADERAELSALAQAISTVPLHAYQWKGSIDEKGDAARVHIGVYAQQVEAAIRSAGLDPARYALWCRDEITEDITDEEGVTRTVPVIDPDTGEPAYRLGLRHDQITALSLMALTGADGRRVAEIEALRAQHDEAMAALVKRVEALEKERPSASL